MSAVEQSSGRLESLSHTVGIATTAIASLGASYVVALQDPMPQWELDLTEWINGVPDGVATMQYPIMQFGTPGGPILVAAAVAIFRRDWWLSGATVVSGFVTWFGAKGVKKIVERGRPGAYLSEINIREGDGTGLEHGVRT